MLFELIVKEVDIVVVVLLFDGKIVVCGVVVFVVI